MQPSRTTFARWACSSRVILTLAFALMLFPKTAFAQSAECYLSVITSPSPFMGNNGEVFRLLDGSIWEVKYEYEYMYEYSPEVVVCPGHGVAIVGGHKLNVQMLSRPVLKGPAQTPPTADFIESQIDGDFEGWQGETIFKLTNGQIWQQSSYAYTYSYSFMPRVIIFRHGTAYEMQVEGVSGRIQVMRLR